MKERIQRHFPWITALILAVFCGCFLLMYVSPMKDVSLDLSVRPPDSLDYDPEQYDSKGWSVYTRQGDAADFRDVTDIDAVDDVIEQIDKLRSYRRDSKLEKKLPDRFFPQKIFVFIHCEESLSNEYRKPQQMNRGSFIR